MAEGLREISRLATRDYAERYGITDLCDRAWLSVAMAEIVADMAVRRGLMSDKTR